VIEQIVIDGRKATVADTPFGMKKVLFENGDMILLSPQKQESKAKDSLLNRLFGK